MVDQRFPGLTPEARRHLRNQAVHAVRLLAESLEHADDEPQSAAEGQALVARLQAAIEPLRASTAALSGEGTLTGAPPPGTAAAALSGSGTLSVAVHHVVQVHDTVAVLVSATVTLTAQDATGTPPPATGSGSGTVTVTGTGHGEAPQTFQVTADDTPLIMWQILLRLDPVQPAPRVGLVAAAKPLSWGLQLSWFHTVIDDVICAVLIRNISRHCIYVLLLEACGRYLVVAT